MDRPPLGIMPQYIWKEKRWYELGQAINRGIEAGYPIKQEWVDEYNKLHEELSELVWE